MRVAVAGLAVIMKFSDALAAIAVDESVPVTPAVLQVIAVLFNRVAPCWSWTVAVPKFVWHQIEVAVMVPIKLKKKLFWLSFVVSTGAVVVLSAPAT